MSDLRATYLRWVRRAASVFLMPLPLTALLQWASRAAWWRDPIPAAEALRFLLVSVAVASVIIGRSIRARRTASLPVSGAALVSLSWWLVICACAPSAIGAVLALATRSIGDFYVTLAITLAGLIVLFPRYDQWLAWSAPVERGAV